MEASANGNGNRTFQTLSLIIAGVSLLLSLGFAFYTTANPKGDVLLVKMEAREDLRRAEDRLEGEILRIKNFNGEKLLTKDEHLEYVKRTDKTTDNLRDEVNRIRADQVTRSEHQQHWVDTGAQIAAVREVTAQLRKELIDSIAAMQKDIGGQYTLGDQIKNLQDQLKTLNNRVDGHQLAPAK